MNGRENGANDVSAEADESMETNDLSDEEADRAVAAVDPPSLEERFERVIADDSFLHAPLPSLYRATIDPVQNPPNTRLIITKIINENFKSYPGKHILGPFHQHFSCVVGPNGSGKSNVIDSLLFVFGYRAQKIRSKKLSVLIHNSSEHGSFKFCTVEVCFARIADQGDQCDGSEYEKGCDILPESEMSITRTVHEDGSSFYKINDRRVQYSDVTALLKNLGIDIEHNRFLIQQGEVEMIAMMKPMGADGEAGLLEYLEDIIGSSRLKNTISKLEGKVEELFDVKTERATRMRYAESEMKTVEQAKDEAVLYLRVSNAVARSRHTIKQGKLRQLTSILSTKSDELKAAVEEVEQLKTDIESKKMELKTLEKEQESTKKRRQNLIAEKQNCTAALRKLEEAEEKRDSTIERLKKRIEELNESIEASEQQMEELRKQLEDSEESSEGRRKKLSIVQKEAEELKEKLEEKTKALAVQSADLQRNIDEVERKLNTRKPQENSILSKISAFKNKLSELTSKERRDQADVETKTEELKKITEQLQEEDRTFAALQQNVKELGEQYHSQKKKAEIAAEEESRKVAQYRNAEHKLASLKETYQDVKYPNETLNAILEEGRSGRIPGILGRLGDFGLIAEKYDVAFCTACRGIDNVVVDTLATARKCVDFLKRRNKGRASFICMDKLDRFKSSMKRPVSVPSGARRLFDLLEVEDEQMLPAFYSTITDTLVADDFVLAKRIALHSGPSRWRVVTLKGEVIEKSGVMSGGGVAKGGKLGRRGRALNPSLANISTDELRSTEGTARQLQSVAEEALKAKQAAEDELERTTELLRQKALERDASKRKVENLSTHKSALETEIAEIKKFLNSSDRLQPEVQNVKQRLSNLEAEHKKFLSEQSSFTQEMERLQKELREMTEKETGWLQSRLKDCNDALKEENGALRKLDCSIKKILKTMKVCEEKIRQSKEELRESKAKLENIDQQRDTNQQKIKELSQRLEEYNVELEPLEPRLKELTDLTSQLRQLIQDFSSQLIDKTNSCQTLKEEVDNIRVRFEKLKTDVEAIKLQDLSDLKPFVPASNRPASEGRTLEDLLEKVYFKSDCVDKLVAPNEDEMERIDFDELKELMAELKHFLGTLNSNVSAIDEYRHRASVYEKFRDQVNRVNQLHERALKRYEEVKSMRRLEFMNGFEKIASKLKEVYRSIAIGGDADLELVDYTNPFSEGVILSVRPPRKSWKQISNLSGGEKTLSSLAFIFALHSYCPAPFYVMDEIDAALDFNNVDIIANHVKRLTMNSQFIVVSLRCEMFEKCPHLVGVYKVHNGTLIQPLNIKEFEHRLEAIKTVSHLPSIKSVVDDVQDVD